eukprot:TRINITY_DN9363_c0_g1_i1.p1 TRINITY_DN9363_c0_g1~~TRINITY_DN9363_c0_g1_i1.p1  ORF type:complete len:445 (+),score=105.67 TRINITY_DN9363_c0_g1_i1:108-1442(+)
MQKSSKKDAISPKSRRLSLNLSSDSPKPKAKVSLMATIASEEMSKLIKSSCRSVQNLISLPKRSQKAKVDLPKPKFAKDSLISKTSKGTPTKGLSKSKEYLVNKENIGSPQRNAASMSVFPRTPTQKPMTPTTPSSASKDPNALSPKKRKLTHKGTFSSIFSKKAKAVGDVRSIFDDKPLLNVFGVELDSLMERQRAEHPEIECDIPVIVSKAIEYLLFHGVSEQGIFRVSANHGTLLQLREDIEHGKFTEFADREDCDAHLVACMLKMYLREIPNSLLTGERFDAFIESTSDSEQPNLKLLKETIESLPANNKKLVRELFHLFHTLSTNSQTNSMHAQNLATTNAPNLLFKKDDLASSCSFESITSINNVVEVMINHYLFLFQDENQAKQIDEIPEEIQDLKEGASGLNLDFGISSEIEVGDESEMDGKLDEVVKAFFPVGNE